MIVYSATRREFTHDVLSNNIEDEILDVFSTRLGRRPPRSEINAWKNSMQYMNNAVTQGGISDDAGVAIEYQIPLTSRRVDFILSGMDEQNRDTAVIVELKQWTDVRPTPKDAIVQTFVGGAVREVTHPSYQAWTYAALIKDYNADVQDQGIALRPCAYLHNCRDGSVLRSPFYADHTRRAPVFLRDDVQSLADFLRTHVAKGDRSGVLYRIDHGRIRPSKNLADHLVSLLRGNQEFQMIDDQKIVYETALELSGQGSPDRKKVLLVEGGPGTGKSVVAVNLLVELTSRGLVAQYVSRNAAPRTVYESKLAGTFQKTRIANLFKGSGTFVDRPKDELDCLIVDEAHRLNAKSGLFQNQGDNQIAEIVHSAKCAVFFLDQDQRVTLKDIGDRDEIRRVAEEAGADLTELKLASQFRCNGSDGYLAWVSDSLQIEGTANESLAGVDYDFRVLDSPNELRDLIRLRNEERNKARMVAGYCWDWKGKRSPNVKDVNIPEYGFAMRWNLDQDGSLWIVAPSSVSEIGCIHTCQGLELDYVGVIVGRDLVVRHGDVVTDAAQRSSQDRSIHGYKKMLKSDPGTAKALTDRIIKNTYRTLMTRGQRGCYIFCVDRETNEYFKMRAGGRTAATDADMLQAADAPPPPYKR